MCNYLPLEKGVALHFNKLKPLSSKDAFVPSLALAGRRTTENRQSEQLTSAFSSSDKPQNTLKIKKRIGLKRQSG